MNRTVVYTLLLYGLFVAGVPAVRAEFWPGWRGPRGDGTCIEQDVPAAWDPNTALWKTRLPGRGHASPRVFASTDQ